MNHRRALEHLKRADPVMARVIRRVGPCRFGVRTEGSHFHHLVRAIVYQQLSWKAAATIHRRFLELMNSDAPEPAAVAAMHLRRLRSVGLSRQKAGYIRDLAGHVHTGRLPLDRIHELPDDQVIEALTAVKGIGVWSAQMFLMSRLGRPDVLPSLDLGIRKGVQLAYGLRSLPTPKRVRKIGAPWSPWSTIGSWYMWRCLDGPTLEQRTSLPKRGK
ncbi:MAG: DNA-3-methyladenine glycosylase family protein [Gemmatimonadales bacterium]